MPPFNGFGLDPTSTFVTVYNPLPVSTSTQKVPLLLTVPNQLGVDYCAHTIEAVLKHVAPALGWR